MVDVKPVKTYSSRDYPMAALADLLQESHTDSARLFEHGLALLVKTLGVDRALLTRVTDQGYEVLWWAVGPKVSMGEVLKAPEKGFCPFTLAHPDQPLTIKDAARDPRWSEISGYREFGIRAYAGMALMVGGRPYGTLSVQHHAPQTFSKAELALVRAMGHLMARTLESENLKRELRAALDALELSSSIVEDSAMQSARSGLPNRRFLETWLRATLFLARRRKESMTLALWSQPMVPGTKGRLTTAASLLRGEDLLVELSTDQYLLLMPHTGNSGAEVLLARLRETLGYHPTGATLWLPDGKDMTMKSALRRVAKAFTDANREGSPLLWNHG